MALTIAGSDPTGGAGLQADLQTFASLGVHGEGVVTAVTVQDTARVHRTYSLPEDQVREQLAALLADTPVQAAKTGMLANGGIVRAVGQLLADRPEVRLVVDPVIASSSGQRLLDEDGIEAARELLIPRAELVTPNLGEAEVLAGMRADTIDQMEACARALEGMGARAVLVTGGHLRGDPVDVLCISGECTALSAERLRPGERVHGTGCALAAAAAALLARGDRTQEAVGKARAYVAEGIRHARPIGQGALVLNYVKAGAAIG